MGKGTTNWITQKLRIYPNKQQKSLFTKCLNGHRYFYNKANEYIKKIGKIIRLPSLRKEVLKSDKDLEEKELWQSEIPYDTRQLAINQLITSYKSSLTLKQLGYIEKGFDVKFLKKKSTKQIFHVNKDAVKITDKGTIAIFPTRLKKQKFIRLRKRDRQKLKSMYKIDNDVIIQRLSCRKWYIFIPKEVVVKPQKEFPFNSAFLDPGVRTFQTYYSPEGVCGKLGDSFCKENVVPLLKKHDSLQSNGRDHRKRALLINKVKNLIDSLRQQTTNFLCKNFRNIFISDFKVKQMVSKYKKISSKVSRSMLNLSHYKFKEFLKYYGKKNGNNIQIVNESWTSKTCGRCGTIKWDLGSKKVFNCSKCNLTIDRDFHAARNICLKTINGSVVRGPNSPKNKVVLSVKLLPDGRINPVKIIRTIGYL